MASTSVCIGFLLEFGWLVGWLVGVGWVSFFGVDLDGRLVEVGLFCLWDRVVDEVVMVVPSVISE
jgi:hypothetical protein